MHPECVAPVRAGSSPELGKASSGVSFLLGKGLCVYQLSPCRRNFTSPGQVSSWPAQRACALAPWMQTAGVQPGDFFILILLLLSPMSLTNCHLHAIVDNDKSHLL